MAKQGEALGAEHLLPYEQKAAGSDEDAASKLFSLLESDPLVGDDKPRKGESEGDDADEADEPGAGEADDESGADDEGEKPGEDADDDTDADEDESAGDGEDDDQQGEDLDALYERLRTAGYKRKIKANGADIEVALEELDSGYSRTADYTRKTTETKQERERFVQAREKYDAGLADVMALLAARKPKQRTADEWDELKREDPTAYTVAWTEQEQHRSAAEHVSRERAKVAEQRDADAAAAWNAHVEAEATALHTAIPEFADPEKGPVAKRKLNEYLTGTYAFSERDVKSVADHRLLVMARKAMLYDEAQKSGKTKIREKQVRVAGKPLAPGGRRQDAQQPAGRKQIRKLKDRLVKSGGRPDVAEAAMYEILGEEEKLSRRR